MKELSTFVLMRVPTNEETFHTALKEHDDHHKSHDNVDKKKAAKELPGPRRGRFGSTLTARDPNTRGSKSFYLTRFNHF